MQDRQKAFRRLLMHGIPKLYDEVYGENFWYKDRAEYVSVIKIGPD